MSRGYTEFDALSMVVEGFIEQFIKELPLEFSVELPRLLNLKMQHTTTNILCDDKT
jgi:Fe-S cluster assembly protein SufB